MISGLAGGAAILMASPSFARGGSVRMNEVLRSLFFTPQYVALKINAFQEEAIDVTGLKTTWGTQAALTEIVSGSSDIALMGPEAAILTRKADKRRRLFNFAQLTRGDGSFILSKTPMPDFKVADLKGKTIVTSGKGSTPALALLHIIKQAGLNPDKDLTIRFIPQSANIIPSYLESNTSFAHAIEPAIYRAVSENKGYRVASVGKLLGELPYTTYMATEEFITAHPERIQGFTNAIQKGLNWTAAHSAQEIADLVAEYFTGLPRDILVPVIEEYKKIDIWSKSTLISPDGMKRMSDLLVEGGVVEQGAAYEDVVKPEFAKNAEKLIR